MKYTKSLGDVSKVVYGGFLVNELTGDAIYFDDPTFDVEDHPEKTITCYRFTIAENVIDDLSWLKKEDWFNVGEFIGEKYIMLTAISGNILDRARIYEAVGRYYGFNNLDGYPAEYTFAELEAMYPD